MSKGRIAEQGTHNELLENRSMYYELVEKQRMSTERDNIISEAKSALNGESDESDFKDGGKETSEYAHEMRPYRGTEESEQDFQREDGDYEYSLWVLIKFVANFNKKERFTMISGLFWSIITGAGNPTYDSIPPALEEHSC